MQLHHSSNTVVYAGVTETITNCYEYINNLDYDCFIIEYLSVLTDQQKVVRLWPHQINLLVGFEDSLLCLNDSSNTMAMPPVTKLPVAKPGGEAHV